MGERKIEAKPNSVAILEYHDGSAGQVEAWFEEETGFHIACFVYEAAGPLCIDSYYENTKRVTTRTEYPIRDSFKGRPLIVAMDWIDKLVDSGIKKVLPLTRNNKDRKRQIELCRQNDIELVSAIHPSVINLSGSTVEPGVWINAGSIIGYKVEIETGVLINTGSLIEHHNVLRECCQVDPGVVTASNVTLRECCYVHAGATIINHCEVGENAIVGAGSVVTKNIPPNCMAFGVPAKVMKEH